MVALCGKLDARSIFTPKKKKAWFRKTAEMCGILFHHILYFKAICLNKSPQCTKNFEAYWQQTSHVHRSPGFIFMVSFSLILKTTSYKTSPWWMCALWTVLSRYMSCPIPNTWHMNSRNSKTHHWDWGVHYIFKVHAGAAGKTEVLVSCSHEMVLWPDCSYISSSNWNTACLVLWQIIDGKLLETDSVFNATTQKSLKI